jgi:Tfp pilus assembly protein PilX
LRNREATEKGFALIAAIMALMVLTAVGLLAFSLSTQDIRTSGRLIGEKKAFSGVEAGVHLFTQTFDPANLNASVVAVPTMVNAATDPATRYTIGLPARPTSGPGSLPLPGYAIGGGQQWGQERFDNQVRGMNTNYNSLVQVNIGAGFGPIEITTAYR